MGARARSRSRPTQPVGAAAPRAAPTTMAAAMGGDGRGRQTVLDAGQGRRRAHPQPGRDRQPARLRPRPTSRSTSNSGIRAIINSALVSYERLPMLEIVFDRLVRLMTTSLRNFTSDNVEVRLDNITSIRFGDYLNSIPLPAILAVFRAEEWDNFGLCHRRFEPDLFDRRRAARRPPRQPRCASRAGPTPRSSPSWSSA